MESPEPSSPDWIALGADPLPIVSAIEWATVPAAGAVVTFLGTVRDHADGRDGVTGLTYEAYDEEALRIMREIASDARHRWPAITRLALLHRTGALVLTEVSVAVVISSPHRAEAFDAARSCIDTLKETVPIWKHEHWDGGSDWAVGATEIRALHRVPTPPPAAATGRS